MMLMIMITACQDDDYDNFCDWYDKDYYNDYYGDDYDDYDYVYCLDHCYDYYDDNIVII